MDNKYLIDLPDDGVECGVEPDADCVEHKVVVPLQTHSCNVGVISRDGTLPGLEDTDAIISLKDGIRIGVRTADCVPVLIYAPDIKAVAAVHAGWKGSIGGILDNVVEKLHELGADTKLMKVSFGPSICGNCYEVSDEMIGKFTDAGFQNAILPSRHISLEKVNEIRLLRSGVDSRNIHSGICCTREATFLPSWRRQQTSKRLLTWIEIATSRT